MKDSTTAESIIQRLKQAIACSTDAELARDIGITQQAIYNARSVNRVPEVWVLRTALKTGVSVGWLELGTEPTKANPINPIVEESKAYRVYDEAGVEIIETNKTDIVLIPMVEAKLSAGQGSFETSDQSDRKYSFRRDFLSRKGNQKEMVLMRVSGDSMEPEIKNGDVVLLDKSQTSPLPGRIYAVGVEDMVYLKRVDARPGKIVLYSDNKDYAPIEVDTRGDMENQARIIGRAIWWCREA